MLDTSTLFTKLLIGYHLHVQISWITLTLRRKRPLRVSYGIASESVNLFVFVQEDEITGIGEMAPIGYDETQNVPFAIEFLKKHTHRLEKFSPANLLDIESESKNLEMISALKSAILNACYDWLGKKANLPLWKLLGLKRNMPPTSVTVGIEEPEAVEEITKEVLAETPSPFLKLKLGGDGGIEKDKMRYQSATSALTQETRIRVDANGSWSLNDAVEMSDWLAENGCDYLEQPLPKEDIAGYEELYKQRKLPIYLDECIFNSKDVVKFAHCCDGINIKLLKSGGISEALRIVATARALNKKTMIGCFGETSVGISAGASLGSLFDCIDLDSHLNMNPDPAIGLNYENGSLMLSDNPGIGVELTQ